jgi:methyl-accepting chemotaxis protein
MSAEQPKSFLGRGFSFRVKMVAPPLALIVGVSIFVALFFPPRMIASDRDPLWTAVAVSAVILLLGSGIAVWTWIFLLRPLRALVAAIDRIVRTGDLGQPVPVSSQDEVGALGGAFRSMLEKLQIAPLTIEEISIAISDLTRLVTDHAELALQQSARLTEATSTMEEIRQTSSVAASKAELVIQAAQKAEESSATGQTTIENSLTGLQQNQAQIEQVVLQISNLTEHTQLVGEIIQTVKDLADQSNMLALNASIEAVRAGEMGRGFGVVAAEIRSLADQSITATGRVREVLTTIQTAIRTTASLAEQRKGDMDRSMEQMRVSGTILREMAAAVAESNQAARQIAVSVSQQNVGITQIASAIQSLGDALSRSNESIRGAEQAAASLKALSDEVSTVLSGSLK